MSTSSKAFEKLLKDEVYFQNKIEDLLSHKGNLKLTSDDIDEFTCDLIDSKEDIRTALKGITKIHAKISQMTESDMTILDIPASYLKSAKEYLYKLFLLIKLDHEVWLHCIEGQWEEAIKNIETISSEKGETIAYQFGSTDSQLELAKYGSRFADTLVANEDQALELIEDTKDLRKLKSLRSKFPQGFKRIFPMLENLLELPRKRRRLND